MSEVLEIWSEVVDHGVPDEVCKAITRYAIDSPDAEICGFILNDGTICPVPNISEMPRYGFDMDKDVMMRVIADPKGVLGTYHSHPSGRQWPSAVDSENMTFLYQQGCPWRYFIVTGGGLYEFRHKDRTA